MVALGWHISFYMYKHLVNILRIKFYDIFSLYFIFSDNFDKYFYNFLFF